MRCQRVGANVSPMRGMLSLAPMLIKPALLSQCEPAARLLQNERERPSRYLRSALGVLRPSQIGAPVIERLAVDMIGEMEPPNVATEKIEAYEAMWGLAVPLS